MKRRFARKKPNQAIWVWEFQPSNNVEQKVTSGRLVQFLLKNIEPKICSSKQWNFFKTEGDVMNHSDRKS